MMVTDMATKKASVSKGSIPRMVVPAAIATGTVLGILVLNKEEALQSDDGPCPNHVCEDRDGMDEVDDTRNLATWTTVALGGGLVFAAAGVVALVTLPANKERAIPARSATRLVPAASPSQASLSLIGRF